MHMMDLRAVISARTQQLQPPSSTPRVIEADTRSLGPHRDRCCRAVAWIESKAAIVVGGDDTHISIFDSDGKEGPVIEKAHKNRILGMCVLARGFLVTISQGHRISLWDVRRNSARVATIPTPRGSIATAVCTLYDSTFVVGTLEGSLAVYSNDSNRLRSRGRFPYEHIDRIDTMHAASGLLASGSKDQKVVLRRITDMQRVATLYHGERVHAVRIDAQYVATGTLKKVYLYSNGGNSFPIRAAIKVDAAVIWSLRFLNERTLMATGDNRLRFIDVQRCLVTHEIETTARFIHNAEILPSGQVAIVGAGHQANAIVELPRELSRLIAGTKAKYDYNRDSNMTSINEDLTKHSKLDSQSYQSPKKEKSEAKEAKVEDLDAQVAVEIVTDNQVQAHSNHNAAASTQLGPQPVPNTVPVNQVRSGGTGSERSPSNSITSSDCKNHQQAIANNLVQQAVGFPRIGHAAASSTVNSNIREHTRGPAEVEVVDDDKDDEKELVVCEKDEIVEIMRKWENVGMSKSAISRLEPEELAEAMASYMLRYRIEWKEKLPSLKLCLQKLFDHDLLLGEDLVGLAAENMKKLHQDIVKAMKEDEKVGAKTGLVHAAQRFLRQLA